jgi:addiction module RelE/StbE family toxin
MAEIHYSPTALNDLDEIWTYISQNFCNPIAAQNTIDGIMDAVDMLSDQPKMGTPLYFLSGLNSGYRYVIHGNYMAFYRTNRTDVYIDRVLYGKSDYMRVLFKDED